MAQLTRFRSTVAHRTVTRPTIVRLGIVLGLTLFATALPGASARAQGYGFFGNLFGGGAPQQPYAPPYPGYGNNYNPGYGYAPRGRADGYYYDARPRYRPRRKPAEAVQQREAQPREKAPPPKNASLFVDVFGDSLALSLATGLDEAFANRGDVGIVHRARAGLGLASPGSFDWAKEVGEAHPGADGSGQAKSEPGKSDQAKSDQPKSEASKSETSKSEPGKPAKIDVAVMMIGTADRQPISVDGKTLQPGTPEWNAAYAKRVLAVAELFRARKIPLVWVGIPITKDDDVADGMAALNEIYKDAAAKTGAIFVDTWEAFSDDDGDFSSSGPDINGQTVRLRSADGINFTRAGARKLAHFVETHVTRALEGKTPVPQAPPAEAHAPDKGGKPVAAVRPDAGPVRDLNAPPVAKSGTLATAGNARPHEGDDAPTSASPLGRADDAHWSGKPDDR